MVRQGDWVESAYSVLKGHELADIHRTHLRRHRMQWHNTRIVVTRIFRAIEQVYGMIWGKRTVFDDKPIPPVSGADRDATDNTQYLAVTVWHLCRGLQRDNPWILPMRQLHMQAGHDGIDERVESSSEAERTGHLWVETGHSRHLLVPPPPARGQAIPAESSHGTIVQHEEGTGAASSGESTQGPRRSTHNEPAGPHLDLVETMHMHRAMEASLWGSHTNDNWESGSSFQLRQLLTRRTPPRLD